MFKFTFLILSLIMVGSLSQAQVNLGTTVNPYVENGKPKFGVQFAHEDEGFIFSSMITIIGHDLTNGTGLLTLAYRLYNSNTNSFITDWTVLENHTSPVYLPGTYVLPLRNEQVATVKAIIKGLPSLKIILAVNTNLANPSPTHNIPLGDYCSTNPDHFLDITTGNVGCVVTP